MRGDKKEGTAEWMATRFEPEGGVSSVGGSTPLPSSNFEQFDDEKDYDYYWGELESWEIHYKLMDDDYIEYLMKKYGE